MLKKSKRWSRWPDLNRRPIDYESIALPTELHRHHLHNIRKIYIDKIKDFLSSCIL